MVTLTGWESGSKESSKRPIDNSSLKMKECVICQRKVLTDYEGYCQRCHDEIAERNVREGSK